MSIRVSVKDGARYREIENGPFPITIDQLEEARAIFSKEYDSTPALRGAKISPQTTARAILNQVAPQLSEFDVLMLGFAITNPKIKILTMTAPQNPTPTPAAPRVEEDPLALLIEHTKQLERHTATLTAEIDQLRKCRETDHKVFVQTHIELEQATAALRKCEGERDAAYARGRDQMRMKMEEAYESLLADARKQVQEAVQVVIKQTADRDALAERVRELTNEQALRAQERATTELCLSELRAQLADAGKDQERIDWLEKQWNPRAYKKDGSWGFIAGDGTQIITGSGPTIRAAIDAARK